MLNKKDFDPYFTKSDTAKNIYFILFLYLLHNKQV